MGRTRGTLRAHKGHIGCILDFINVQVAIIHYISVCYKEHKYMQKQPFYHFIYNFVQGSSGAIVGYVSRMGQREY